MVSKDFIEVTALYDGKKAAIRAEYIESAIDNAEDRNGEEIKLACRTINYAGRSINVIESCDEILDMIFHAEL